MAPRGLRHAGAFRRRFPAIALDDDALFVGDGRVYCSAGVTAGMDLALALVEADMGPEVALAIARGLVLFMRRPGGQSQFSVRLEAQGARSTPVRAAAEWAVENLGRRLTVEAMAERACMAPRTFARAFKRETGVTPGRFLARARIEAARGRLLEGDGPLDAVAADCGFTTAETLRQAFHRAFGIPPGAYRARFRTTLSDKESRP